MSELIETKRPDAWAAAAHLVARWLERHERADELLESLGTTLRGAERARCQHLVFGVIRHFGRIDSALGRLIAHPPRFSTRAVLFLAGFELIDVGSKPEREAVVPKIVHHAVEQTKRLASPAEARLVNAVVRKLAAALQVAPPPKLAEAAALAAYFSHPEWLVKSWLVQFGAEHTRALLEWNQHPPAVYARWRDRAEPPAPWLMATRWPDFYEVPPGHWTEVEPLLKAGKVYLQDPSTRVPVELLAPVAGEIVLDACAAPGGKSLMIADAMQHGRIVAADLPTTRVDRLKENLSRAPAGVEVALVQADLRESFAQTLKEHGLPREFAAVLLDAPCSNTGVMRHRVDVKWRLQPGDFKKHPAQQLALLEAVARLVAPGGRLVYSTCSIDAEENQHVVQEFMTPRAGQWTLEARSLSLPWESGHDGGAAFLMRRKVL